MNPTCNDVEARRLILRVSERIGLIKGYQGSNAGLLLIARTLATKRSAVAL